MKKVDVYGAGPKPVSIGHKPETLAERLGVSAIPRAYWVDEYAAVFRYMDGKFEILSGREWLNRDGFVAQFRAPGRFSWKTMTFRSVHLSDEGIEQIRRFDEMVEAVKELCLSSPRRD